jgi:hypothetical protein
LWNPAFCGDIDMRIAADGSWHYNGSPIGRMAMVKLFASILRKDPDRYVLVTPVERVGIAVDDAPFVVVEIDTDQSEDQTRFFARTNLDDVVEIGEQHPARFSVAADGGLKPYIHIRGDLWALASRPVTHELVQHCVFRTGADNVEWFGLASGQSFFPVAPATDVERWAGQ